MKQQTQRKPMDEREKLRKFRELDDAFAEALRELEGSSAQDEPPLEAAKPDQVSDAARQQHFEENDEKSFEERLRTLMQEYHKPAEQVTDLLVQLKALGRIA